MDEHAIRDYLSGLSREQLEKLVVEFADAVQHSELVSFRPPTEYLDLLTSEMSEHFEYVPGFYHYHTGENLI